MKKILLALTAASALCSSALATPFNSDAARFTLPEGQLVAHIDMERMRSSQTFKDLAAMITGNPAAQKDLEELKARFGVDPINGIGSITLSVNAAAKGAPPEVAAYVTGAFPQAQILEALKKESKDFDAVKEGEHTMYVAQNDSSTITFVKGGMLATGSDGAVKGDAVARKVLAGAGVTGAVKVTTGSFDGSKDVWATFQPSAAMVADMQAQNPMMGAFTAWTVSMDFTPGLHVHIEGKGTEAAASQIAAMASMQLQQMQASPQAAMLGGMMSKLSVTSKGELLVVDMPLNQQDVNQLKMMAMMMMMSLQQPKAQPSFPGLQAPVAPSVAPKAPAAPPALLAPTPAPK